LIAVSQQLTTAAFSITEINSSSPIYQCLKYFKQAINLFFFMICKIFTKFHQTNIHLVLSLIVCDWWIFACWLWIIGCLTILHLFHHLYLLAINLTWNLYFQHLLLLFSVTFLTSCVSLRLSNKINEKCLSIFFTDMTMFVFISFFSNKVWISNYSMWKAYQLTKVCFS